MRKTSRVIVMLAALFMGGIPVAGVADEPKAQAVQAVEIFEVDLEDVEEVEAVPQKKAGAVMLRQLIAPLFGAAAPEGNDDVKAMDAQVQQWIGQFQQQYRPMLWTELNFIRLNCDLAVEQRPQVKAAGDAALKEIVRKMAERQVRPNRGGQSQVEPRKAIRKALLDALEHTLSTDAMQKFQQELNQRTERRKQAAILTVLARMDAALLLTEEQRTAIEKSLTSSWQEDWEQWLFIHIYGDQYFPTVPDQHVVPHLNKDQKAVWNTLQKINFGFWGGGGQAIDVAWWGDKPDANDGAAGGAAVQGVIILQE